MRCVIIRPVLSRSIPARIVPIVLVIVVSSCQGSPSERQGSATNEPANASSGPLGDWTDVDLEKNLNRIGYGATKNILSRGSDGGLVFTPETPQDHIATPFIELRAQSGDRSLDLSVDMTVAGGESCVANLQDDAYNVIATVPCQTTGTQQATVKVPAPVKSVRVYFQSAARQPIRLPTHMRLSEQR